MKDEILNSFCKVADEFVGNSNSLHKLGTSSKKLENAAGKQILDVLNIDNKEVIYTSGRVEANNLLIFGIFDKYKIKKHVILDKNCDDSIKLMLDNYDVDIDYIDDYNDIDELIKDNTVLISLCYFSDIDNVLKSINKYDVLVHVDISNNYNCFLYNLCDFITIEDDDLLGFGCLIKNKNIIIEPLFHGGKSTTVYRSGTPALPFIVAFSKLIKLKYKK